eukprot:PhM_4_TR17314/c0_g1_i1/m.2117
MDLDTVLRALSMSEGDVVRLPTHHVNEKESNHSRHQHRSSATPSPASTATTTTSSQLSATIPNLAPDVREAIQMLEQGGTGRHHPQRCCQQAAGPSFSAAHRLALIDAQLHETAKRVNVLQKKSVAVGVRRLEPVNLQDGSNIEHGDDNDEATMLAEVRALHTKAASTVRWLEDPMNDFMHFNAADDVAKEAHERRVCLARQILATLTRIDEIYVRLFPSLTAAKNVKINNMFSSNNSSNNSRAVTTTTPPAAAAIIMSTAERKDFSPMRRATPPFPRHLYTHTK